MCVCERERERELDKASFLLSLQSIETVTLVFCTQLTAHAGFTLACPWCAGKQACVHGSEAKTQNETDEVSHDAPRPAAHQAH